MKSFLFSIESRINYSLDCGKEKSQWGDAYGKGDIIFDAQTIFSKRRTEYGLNFVLFWKKRVLLRVPADAARIVCSHTLEDTKIRFTFFHGRKSDDMALEAAHWFRLLPCPFFAKTACDGAAVH